MFLSSVCCIDMCVCGCVSMARVSYRLEQCGMLLSERALGNAAGKGARARVFLTPELISILPLGGPTRPRS